MKLKPIIYCLFLVFVSYSLKAQTLKNTSYLNKSGEKVLRFEMILPINISSAWELFTTDAQLKKWAAPLAHIELNAGGYLITNYDVNKSLNDSSSIRLPILAFLDAELLIFKVELNNHFKESVRNSDENLQEIVQFKSIDKTHTQITSSMIGWGNSKDWNEVYDFFAKGNEWTYQELLKNYK